MDEAKSTAAVVARKLVKTDRGRSGTVEAVRGVDLEVKVGESVALQEAGLDPRQSGRELLVLQGASFPGLRRNRPDSTIPTGIGR